VLTLASTGSTSTPRRPASCNSCEICANNRPAGPHVEAEREHAVHGCRNRGWAKPSVICAFTLGIGERNALICLFQNVSEKKFLRAEVQNRRRESANFLP
jgi:hypothetical protein